MGARGGAKEDGSDRKLLTQTLTCMNALHRSVVVVGATNRPQDIDAAVRRRFPYRLHVPLPTAAVRTRLLEATLAAVRQEQSDSKAQASAAELKVPFLPIQPSLLLCLGPLDPPSHTSDS